MFLTVVLPLLEMRSNLELLWCEYGRFLRSVLKAFPEMQQLNEICPNKMYTITGYTAEQINCDGNGGYEDPKSAKKDCLVEIKRKYVKSICCTQRRGQVDPQS